MDSPDNGRQDDGMGPCPGRRAVHEICNSVFDFVHLLVEGRPRANEQSAGAVMHVHVCQLPSEALPIQCGLGGEGAACLLQEGNKITLVLQRRQDVAFGTFVRILHVRTLAGKTSQAAVA